jgi:hypothetical protein
VRAKKKQQNGGIGTRTASCTNEQADEYATFETALKKILTVSHKEMQKKITRASPSHASNGKG